MDLDAVEACALRIIRRTAEVLDDERNLFGLEGARRNEVLQAVVNPYLVLWFDGGGCHGQRTIVHVRMGHPASVPKL